MIFVGVQAIPDARGMVLGGNGNLKGQVDNDNCVVVRASNGELVNGIINPNEENVR